MRCGSSATAPLQQAVRCEIGNIRGTDHEAPSVDVGRGTAGWIRPARSGDSWPSGDHLIAGRDEAAELVARDCVRDDGRPGRSWRRIPTTKARRAVMMRLWAHQADAAQAGARSCRGGRATVVAAWRTGKTVTGLRCPGVCPCRASPCRGSHPGTAGSDRAGVGRLAARGAGHVIGVCSDQARPTMSGRRRPRCASACTGGH